MRVRNSSMRLEVDGGLTAAGTLAQPVTSGEVTLREGGELVLRRAKLRVVRGGWSSTTIHRGRRRWTSWVARR